MNTILLRKGESVKNEKRFVIVRKMCYNVINNCMSKQLGFKVFMMKVFGDSEGGQQMVEYPRGSEWRRWDLHLHTPGTKKNDLFDGGSIEEKWDKFYADIEAYIGDGTDVTRDIAVVGITDYLSIDNYKKVIADNRLPSSVKLIIPNVEMRVTPIAHNSPLNIHFLFNPQFVDSIESSFFSKLSVTYGDSDYSASRQQLINLGHAIDTRMPSDDAAYMKGFEAFVPSIDSVMKVFKNDANLRENTLILVSNRTNDGVSGAVSHSSYFETEDGSPQLAALRSSIYMFVEGIFTPTPNDIDYFLGKKENHPPQKVVEQCGALKPCLHGCDAHENSKIFEPDLKRYCWVKADPTFNGLRQVIYEPEERVRISEIKPETKQAYYVIDSIVFNDPEFQEQPILFSDKLTCIIGGKSTGKSILLRNLAASIDSEQVKKKEEISTTTTKDVTNLTATWCDGKSNEHRKIIYIPQTYLNRLSDEKEENTEIDKLIEEIVLLNVTAKNAHGKMRVFIKEYKNTLDKNILDLIELQRELSSADDKKKELGDKEGIETEILKIKEQKELLSKELSITGAELQEYDEAVRTISVARRNMNVVTGELDALDNLPPIVIATSIDYPFSDETRTAIDLAIKGALEKAEDLWDKEKRKIREGLDAKKAKIEEELAKSTEIEQSLKEKIQGNKAIKELTERLQAEAEKLDELVKLNGQYKVLSEKKMEMLKNIVDSISFFQGQHQAFATVVEAITPKSDDLEFSVESPFKCGAFVEKLKSIFDNKVKEFKDVVSPDVFSEGSYSREKIQEILVKTLSGELPLKKNYTQESALRDIMTDWYETKYRVNMDNDSIDVMSPGKKALVLLKLLIELAESRCPILIDQPEDDLDNRSIFDDLIPFIKKKKKNRQIIVATHNANVVLGADSEEVIVANQRGKNAPNKERRFEYRAGSIENDSCALRLDGSVEAGILNSQGIQQHICDILEGGEKAFALRKSKYHI